MTLTPRPVVQPDDLDRVDLASPILHAENDLDEIWRYLRANDPVHWHRPVDDRPGFWVITRHADVHQVYQDKGHFTTAGGNALATLLTGGDSASGTMLAVTDGPRHRQIRNVMTRGLNPRTLEAVRHSLQQTVDRLLKNALDMGECDAAHDVAANVPLGAICDLLEILAATRPAATRSPAPSWR